MTTMNTKTIPNTKTSRVLALAGAALLAGLAPATLAQEFSAADVARNRAIAASPRAIEMFPWLARGLSAPGEATPVAVRTGRPIRDEVTRNRALAASPRMLEDFPELARVEQAARPASTPPLATGLPTHRGLAATPRAIEDFPALGRPETLTAPSGAFQVAPLK